MISLKKPRFTEKLPGPVVTREMQQQILAYAEANDATVSEVIRAALALFLSGEFMNHEQLYMKHKQTEGKEVIPNSKRGKKAKAAQS